MNMYAIRVTSEKIVRSNSNRQRAFFGLSCRPFRLDESARRDGYLDALTMAGRGCRCCACSLTVLCGFASNLD
jgi:hypothetical protein